MRFWLTAAARVVPLELGVLPLVTGLNLSVFVFFAVSTLQLWHHDPLKPAS